MAKARRRAAALKKAAEEAAQGSASTPSTDEAPGKTPAASLTGKGPAAAVAGDAADHLAHVAGIVCTGELLSHPLARDVKIGNMSLSYHGAKLIEDTTLELTTSRRYGFLGPNGSGKSTLLKAIAYREGIPLPEHIDVFYLDREAPASDLTALEAVIKDVTDTRDRLESVAEKLAEEDPEADALMDIYERLDELDPDKAERDAAKILKGLGFSLEMQAKACKDFSGGWRMRVSLAQALLAQPSLLLLDDPTNHLDLEACVWLEEYLKNYPRCLVMVSHSQDFLNGVCTHIMQLSRGKLNYYTGNYDTYIRTKAELEENQMKRYHWEQAQIADMKNYIARFGHGSAKLARQAQSKEKVLAKMIADGLTEKVYTEKTIHFRFGNVEPLPPPVLQAQAVHFAYPNSPKLYHGVEFGLDMDSRVALVGPNGAGKSTLLKLITQELVPTDGMVRAHQNLNIAQYHQHLTETLDQDLSPLAYMLKEFPELTNGDEGMRKIIGRFGLTGKVQSTPIGKLSDGQKARVVFASLSCRPAHLLCLDEPTNGLDLETIDALADAINAYNGGVVLVSHDFRLINQVAKEIWECRDGDIKIWQGDILAYKKHLRKTMGVAE